MQLPKLPCRTSKEHDWRNLFELSLHQIRHANQKLSEHTGHDSAQSGVSA